MYGATQLGHSKHHDNECITNAFFDHYAYTRMKDNKRDILTREKISMRVGKQGTYVIKEGATMKDLEPRFMKYHLKVRIVDAFTKRLTYKCDHTNPGCHAKPLCCMLNNNHTYVLTYDLKSLEQQHNDERD